MSCGLDTYRTRSQHASRGGCRHSHSLIRTRRHETSVFEVTCPKIPICDPRIASFLLPDTLITMLSLHVLLALVLVCVASGAAFVPQKPSTKAPTALQFKFLKDLGLEKPSWLPDFGGKKEEEEPKAEAETEKEESEEAETVKEE